MFTALPQKALIKLWPIVKWKHPDLGVSGFKMQQVLCFSYLSHHLTLMIL